jgi:hypothetical protein
MALWFGFERTYIGVEVVPDPLESSKSSLWHIRLENGSLKKSLQS